MTIQVRESDIRGRILGEASETYIYIGSIAKGVVLGAAAWAGLKIAADVSSYWPRITPWFASFIVMIVSHITWMRGASVSSARVNVFDSVIPFAMGIVEFGLFGILGQEVEVSQESVGTGREFWMHWMLLFSLHALIASVLVWNRIRNTRIKIDYEEKARPLAIKYREWLKEDMWGAFGFGLGTLALWAILYFVVAGRAPDIWTKATYSAFALILGLLLVIPIRLADNFQRQVEAHFDES